VFSHRTLVWALQAFLWLLLIAAVPAGVEATPKAERLLEVVQGSANPAAWKKAAKDRDQVIATTAFLEVDEDDDPHAGLGGCPRSAEYHPAAVSSVNYTSAGLSHPACASPPTGPPHA
jgi:hypothetical protein